MSSATDMSCGRISATMLPRSRIDQPVGDLVHMREVVLDIDAGAARLLDAAHEVEDLAHLLTASAAVGSSSTIRSAL